MAARYLVDTNVLVYTLDRREPEKRERAREVLRLVGGAGTAALPAQVLSEFANACLRKLEPRPDPATVRREVERLMLAFPILPLTGPVVLEALRGVREHLLSYYDAQVWAVARLGQVGVVLSEDFNPGAVLDGVSFANPLDPAFDLAATPRTLEGWRAGGTYPQRDTRRRLAELVELDRHLRETFDDREAIGRWLSTPNRYLGGLRPVE